MPVEQVLAVARTACEHEVAAETVVDLLGAFHNLPSGASLLECDFSQFIPGSFLRTVFIWCQRNVVSRHPLYLPRVLSFKEMDLVLCHTTLRDYHPRKP